MNTPVITLPPVPTSSMSVEGRRSLATSLLRLKPFTHRSDAMDQILNGYVRVWIHLAMERGLDPRRSSNPKTRGYQAILPAFQQAVTRIGLHDRAAAAWLATSVATRAATEWRKAKEAQGQTPPPIFGSPSPFSTLNQAAPKALNATNPQEP